jgi:hypothetical protein
MEQKMPITDAGKQIMQKYWKYLLAAVAAAVIAEILLFEYAGNSLSFMIYPVIILVIFYSFLMQKAEDLFFQQFSSVNGFSFRKTGLPDSLNGSLFFIGHSPSGRDLVTGRIRDIAFDLFNYQYTVGEGKDAHQYSHTVLRMEYNSPLPPIFLQAKKNWFGGYLPSQDKEKIQLEGNFNEFFNVLTEKGFETEVFQVFTPDVMEKMQTGWKDFSLEFVGQQIYIYSRHVIGKDAELENMYSLSQYLVQKIEPVVKNMKGDLSAMEDYYGKGANLS